MKGFKVEVNTKFSKLIDRSSGQNLVRQVKKEFSKLGPVKVKQAIIQDMIKGVSPVKGQGKYKRYSEGYKKEIREKKSARMRRNASKAVSPVNLRLSGDLHRSLTSTFKSFFGGASLILEFKNFLANIHNNLGAGKSKVIRRLLPTNSNEQFNRRITKVVIDQMVKAVNTVVNKLGRQ